MKVSWVEIRTRRDHSPVTITGKTDLTWGNQFNLLTIKSEHGNEKLNQILETPSLQTSLLLPALNLAPDFLYLLPTSGAGGQGMRIAVSSSHAVSAAFSSIRGLLIILPCSSVVSQLQETVLHELLQHVAFPWQLLQHRSLPLSAVLQEQTAPAWIPHGVTSPTSKPAPAWAPLSTGPQVLAGPCSSTGSPWGHSLLWAHPPVLVWTSMGCRGTACLTMVFTMGFRGISSPVPGAPPPPLSSLIQVSAEIFLSHCLTPLSSYNCSCLFFSTLLTLLSQRHYHHC